MAVSSVEMERANNSPRVPTGSVLGDLRYMSNAEMAGRLPMPSEGTPVTGKFSVTGEMEFTPSQSSEMLAFSWSAAVPAPQPQVQVPTQMAKLTKEGLSNMSLSLGLTHILVEAFVLGMFPAYYWLLHTLNLWTFIPFWYVRVVLRRRGQWFIVEPCWMLNCFMGFYFILTFFQVLPKELQLWGFRGCFMTSCGFLSWSVLVSQNALIYHSISTSAAVIIHLCPSCCFLTLRWQREFGASVEETWPNVFPSVEEMAEGTRSVQLLVAFWVLYSVWWVLYTVWLLSIGLDLPERGTPTIYGNYRRKNLKVFHKIGMKTMRGEGVVYMLIHAVLCFFSSVWALACWWSFYVHVFWVSTLLLFTLWMSADYYMREVIDKCNVLEQVPAAMPEPEPFPSQPEPQERNLSMEEEYD